MATKRMHVVLSDQLVKEIDMLVGSRQRSSFLTQAAEEKLMCLRSKIRRVRTCEKLRAQLEHSAVRDRDLNRETAADWSFVDTMGPQRP